MKLSRFASHLLIFVFLSALVTQSPYAKENSLEKGKWALQFEISRDFDLSGFQGNTLSVKKHTSDNSAYRLGLTILLDVGDGEIIQEINDSIRYPGDRDFNTRRLDINLQKIFYADPSATINLFYGLGPTTSFSHKKDERNIRDRSSSYVDFDKTVTNSWSLGISGILGIEWFFTKSLSLLGEYGTTFSYSEASLKRERRRVRSGNIASSSYFEEKTNQFRISASAVRFGLSVYF